MLRSSPTARTRIDTPVHTPPVNWRPWATPKWRIIPRASKDGWKLAFRWRKLPKGLVIADAARINVDEPKTHLYDIAVVALRTASDSITRVMPLMIMLTPTKMPIAQTELNGHCK